MELVNDIIAPLAVGGILIPVVLYLARLAKRSFDTCTLMISIDFCDSFPREGTRFGVIHVRDGKDEVKGDEDPINRIKYFRVRWETGTGTVRIRYRKHLGCQFKCFVDCAAIPSEQVAQLLRDKGFEDVSRDHQISTRTWLIDPRFVKTETKDGYINNFFHPSASQ